MSTATRVAAEILRVLPRKRLSSAMGKLSDLSGPQPLVQRAISSFVRAYDVNLDEAVTPPGGFSSFDAFFTRALKPGMRTVDTRPSVIVSPADGRLEDLGRIDARARFHVKGFEYTAAELLGDPAEAERFAGGSFFIVYLSPRDYHRVHSPVAGKVLRARHVDGTLYPVNSIGLTHVPRLFARNERVVTVQDAPGLGEVATIMVGAIGVGRITMSFDDRIVTNAGRAATTQHYGASGPELPRGGELGKFHLGSTAIVMWRGGGNIRPTAGTSVRMGQAIVELSTSP
jgi:phosphatidylserine decarboxylase